jgi:hypothetical protein
MVKHITDKLYAIIVNHNKLPGGKSKGSILKHGAISLHHEKMYGGDVAALEWCLAQLNLGWEFRLHHPGDEYRISGNAQVPGVSLYWHTNLVPSGWEWVQKQLGLYNPDVAVGDKYVTRNVGFSVHNWTLWVSLWAKAGTWSSSDPKWWSFNVSLNPMELLFGSTKYNVGTTIKDVTVDFPLPEGSYKGRVKLQANEWKRPRWPWPNIIVRAHVDMEEPIPYTGKGENSWDCGDDYLHGSCFPCRTVEEAVGNVVGTVLDYRQRYGGSHTFVSREATG